MADNDLQYNLTVAANSQAGTDEFQRNMVGTMQAVEAALKSTSATIEAQNKWLQDNAQRTNEASNAANNHAAMIRNLASQVDRLNASYDPAFASQLKFASSMETLDKALQKGVIDSQAYEAISKKVAEAHGEGEKAARAWTGASGYLGMSFAETTRHLRALGDEAAAGRWKQFDGSLLNIVAHVAAANPALITMGVGIAAGAAAILTFGIAAAQGAAQQAKMNESIAFTGNYAGVTTDALRQMAQSIANSGGNIAVATSALMELTNAGKYTSDQIYLIAQAATDMEQVTGQKVEATVKQFEKLGESPTEASRKLNEQMHYLTLEVYDQIQALEKHGDKLDAARLATESYAQAVIQRTDDMRSQLGILQRIWITLGDAASNAWAKMMNVGKPSTLQDQLAGVDQKIKEAQRQRTSQGGAGGSYSLIPGQNDDTSMNDLMQQRQNLQHKLAAQEATAAQKSLTAAQAQDAIEGSAYVQSLQDKYKGIDRVTDALDKYHAALDKIRKDDESKGVTNDTRLDPSKIAEMETAIRKANDVHQRKPASTRGEDNASYRNDLQDDKDALARDDSTYKDSAAAIQQMFSTKGIDAKQYYDMEQQLISQHVKQLNDDYAAMEKTVQAQASGAKNAADRLNAERQLKTIETERLDALAALGKQSAMTGDTYTESLRKQTAAIEAYQTALDKAEAKRQGGYTKNLNKAGGNGLTGNALAQSNDIDAIYEDYNKRAMELQADAPKDGQDPSAKYTAEKSALQSYLSQALEANKQYYDQLNTLEGQWQTGVQLGMSKFADQAQNTSQIAEKAFGDFANGLDEQLTTLAMTGKANFDKLALAVIQDILRMEIQAAESQIFKLISSVAGGFGGGATGDAAGATAAGSSTPSDLISSYTGHTGAVVGKFYQSGRDVSASVFDGAPRFHSGGVVDGEVPIIAQKGEAVMPTVRMSDGTLGIKAAGSGGGNNVTVHTPITLQVNYQGSGGGMGDDNSQGQQADFAQKMTDHVQTVMDQRISQWAIDQTRPGGALAGANKGRMGV